MSSNNRKSPQKRSSNRNHSGARPNGQQNNKHKASQTNGNHKSQQRRRPVDQQSRSVNNRDRNHRNGGSGHNYDKLHMYILLGVLLASFIFLFVRAYNDVEEEIVTIADSAKEEQTVSTPTDPVVNIEELSDKERADKLINDFAAEHDIPVYKYPKEVRELLENKPEAEEFCLNYPLMVGSSKAYENSKTPLDEFEGCTEVPRLYQWDQRWGYTDYGSSVVGITGCGPTSLSMIAIYLCQDVEMTPGWMAEYATENGYCVEGDGTSWTLFSEGVNKLGLTSEEVKNDIKDIQEVIAPDAPLVIVVHEGVFTTTGHYFVVTGCDGDYLTINDPNSSVNSEKKWNYYDFNDQIENIWVIRKAYSGDEPNDTDYHFRNNARLEEHYQKHGVDMGFYTPQDYEDAAEKVIKDKKSLHKTEAEDGDDVYYKESTNEFVIVSPDGYIRTYFEPSDGKAYYDRQ